MKSNILFVDDEEKILRTMKLIFGKLHNVFLASNGAVAIKIIQNNDIKVIVCDQRMPRMLGVEVLHIVKETSPSTMRILLTGYADVSDIVDSINKAEIFRYIMKPWKNDYLKEVIDLAIVAANEAPVLSSAGDDNPVGDEVTQIPGESIVDISGQVSNSILVIDDDKGTHQLISSFFDKNSNVYYAANLERALEILNQNPEINFIVSELFINNDQATDVLTAIKSQAPHVVIMILTAYRDSELLFKLINEGQIFRFLLKPSSSKMVGISLIRGYEKMREIQGNKKMLARYKVDASQSHTEVGLTGSNSNRNESSLIKRALSIFKLRSA